MADAKQRIQMQAKFCSDLMWRLEDRIEKTEFEDFRPYAGHTSLQQDVIRLRRELMELERKLGRR